MLSHLTLPSPIECPNVKLYFLIPSYHDTFYDVLWHVDVLLRVEGIKNRCCIHDNDFRIKIHRWLREIRRWSHEGYSIVADMCGRGHVQQRDSTSSGNNDSSFCETNYFQMPNTGYGTCIGVVFLRAGKPTCIHGASRGNVASFWNKTRFSISVIAVPHLPRKPKIV